VAVGTALLPLLSRQLRAGEEAAAADSMNRAVEFALLLSVPGAAALMVIAGPVVSVLFERGAFDAASSSATALALAAYAAGLPAYVLVKVLGPAYFARRDTRTPVLIAVAAVVVNVVLNLILMQFLAHAGLALATAIAAWLNVGLLAWVLRRRGHLVADQRLVQRLARSIGAALVMVALLLWLKMLLAEQFVGGEGERIFALAIMVVLGLTGYGLASVLLGAVRWGEIKGLLARRR